MAPQRCVISCASLLAATLLVVLTSARWATQTVPPYARPVAAARCTANVVCDDWKACISALAANPHRRAEFDNVRAHGKVMSLTHHSRPGIVAKPGSILTDVLGWPLTIGYIARLALGDNQYRARTAPLVIHIAGWESRESYGPNDQDIWDNSYVRDIFCRVKQLNIYLVGPQADPTYTSKSWDGGWLTVHHRTGLYHELYAELPSPDMVWAQNPGT